MSTIRITCVLNETRRLASRFVCEVFCFVLFCLVQFTLLFSLSFCLQAFMQLHYAYLFELLFLTHY